MGQLGAAADLPSRLAVWRLEGTNTSLFADGLKHLRQTRWQQGSNHCWINGSFRRSPAKYHWSIGLGGLRRGEGHPWTLKHQGTCWNVQVIQQEGLQCKLWGRANQPATRGGWGPAWAGTGMELSLPIQLHPLVTQCLLSLQPSAALQREGAWKLTPKVKYLSMVQPPSPSWCSSWSGEAWIHRGKEQSLDKLGPSLPPSCSESQQVGSQTQVLCGSAVLSTSLSNSVLKQFQPWTDLLNTAIWRSRNKEEERQN